MFMKVMAAIACVLLAVLVGLVALGIQIYADTRYYGSEDPARRIYTYEPDWKDTGPEHFFFEGSIPSPMSDSDEECVSVSMDPIGDGQYSILLDTRCK